MPNCKFVGLSVWPGLKTPKNSKILKSAINWLKTKKLKF